MRFNLSKIRLLSSAVAFLDCVGCVSTGPVTTEIDTRRYPIVQRPSEFQSSFEALNKFSEILSQTLSDSKSILHLAKDSFKALLDHQVDIDTELKNTNQLLLKPGHSYEFDLESFCVHAGVERPVSGDGLFLGAINGSPIKWLPQILEKYKSKGISQNDTQILIWSLLSGARFNELSLENRSNLVKIFPDAATRFGSSLIEDSAKAYLMSQVPSEVLSVRDKFDDFKYLLKHTQNQFAEIEKVLSPESSRQKTIPVGWLKHEDGYFLQLKSGSYQKIHVQIYAPENIRASTYFVPSKYVALPGQGQGLALSGNVIAKSYDDVGRFFKRSSGISLKEAAFISKHPMDAVYIYQAAEIALNSTWNHFKSSNHFEDDHTDAFRHFVWSGLVTYKIGSTKAREYLEAHEDFQGNNIRAKEMDLFNNNQGISYGIKYHGSDFEHDVIDEGLSRVKNRELRCFK